MKKQPIYLCFLLCLFLFMIDLDSFAQKNNDSLLVYYTWNNNYFDHSGNGYHPVHFDAQYVPDRFGRDSAALYFDGETNFIALPNLPELKPPLPLSFSFWAKMVDDSYKYGVFFTNDFSEDGHCGAWINYGTNKKLSVSYGDGTGFYAEYRWSKHSEHIIEPHGWYFFTGVIHDSANISLYVNGVDDGGYYEGGATTMTYIGTGGNVGRKDANHHLPPYYYKGYLDELKYWSRALTGTEVYDMYLEGLVLTESDIFEQSVKVFPNPASSILSVVFNNNEELKYTIRDVFGKKVDEGICSNTIDISVLKSGLYFLHLKHPVDDLEFTEKFIKE